VLYLKIVYKLGLGTEKLCIYCVWVRRDCIYTACGYGEIVYILRTAGVSVHKHSVNAKGNVKPIKSQKDKIMKHGQRK
jgi:hypothetical protein